MRPHLNSESILARSQYVSESVASLQKAHPKVLPIARAVVYQYPDPAAPFLVAQRPAESNNYRNRWEFLGGKIEKSANYRFQPDAPMWEDPAWRVTQEIQQEAMIPFHAFGQLDVAPVEHCYVLDDPMSKFDGYLIWTMMYTFALYHTDFAKIIRTPEHQNHMWLTAEEAIDAYDSGLFDLQPQSDFMLPGLLRAAQTNRWR